MIKRKYIILAMSFALAFLAVAYFILTKVYSKFDNPIEQININNYKIFVEVVLTTDKMQKGLGGRESICSSCGMLFKFQNAGKYSFWMKDMKFPLDLIWILQNRIVHIEKNIEPTFVGTLSSLEDADTVLEINSGKADELKLKIGDNVRMHCNAP